MFRFLVIAAIITLAFGFGPSTRVSSRSNALTMSAQKTASKIALATLIASSIFSVPAFSKTEANIGIFKNDALSSPFAEGEDREDPMFSPYSPYGDGSKATYNARKGGSEEITFWKNQFNNCV